MRDGKEYEEVNYPPDAPVIKANRHLMLFSAACDRSAMSTELGNWDEQLLCSLLYEARPKAEVSEDAVNCQSGD
jgi:hypothetical protein